MNPVKIFIILIFLPAFSFQVSAQDEVPKIVWKNLKDKYKSFYDIKPTIVNENDRAIFFYDPYYSVKLAYFDETTKKWETIYFFICGTGLKLTPLKLIPQSDFALNLDDMFWKANSEVSPAGIDPLRNLREIGTGRFRLELDYGLKKSQITQTAVSPDFEVKVISN